MSMALLPGRESHRRGFWVGGQAALGGTPTSQAGWPSPGGSPRLSESLPAAAAFFYEGKFGLMSPTRGGSPGPGRPRLCPGLRSIRGPLSCFILLSPSIFKWGKGTEEAGKPRFSTPKLTYDFVKLKKHTP